MQIKLKNLLPFRNIWLGYAILWIALFHSGIWTSSDFFNGLKTWGYGGVDICLFASGIGCYYSLEKDSDILRFQKRRLKRLAPTYISFILVWLFFKVCTSGLSRTAILGNLLGIQHLTGLGYSFNWYIGALWIFYILMPYFKALADCSEIRRLHLAVVAGMLLFSVSFWNSSFLIIIVTRFPVIYLGLLFGKACKQDRVIGVKEILISIIAMLAGFYMLLKVSQHFPDDLWSHGLYWYPFILIAAGMCILFSLVSMGLEKCKIGQWINKGVDCLGRNSFEIYLVHDMLYETVIPWLTERYSIPGGNFFWICTIPVIAIGCIGLKIMARFSSRLLCRNVFVS